MRTGIALLAFSLITGGAAAQTIPGDDPMAPSSDPTVPLIERPLERRTRDNPPDRALPYRDLSADIRIELPADTLYDFSRSVVRPDAEDLLTQAANLIFERARGTIRIECHYEVGYPDETRRLSARCASAIEQWLIKHEKLTQFRFAIASAPPPRAPSSEFTSGPMPGTLANPDTDTMVPRPPSGNNLYIVFAKR